MSSNSTDEAAEVLDLIGEYTQKLAKLIEDFDKEVNKGDRVYFSVGIALLLAALASGLLWFLEIGGMSKEVPFIAVGLLLIWLFAIKFMIAYQEDKANQHLSVTVSIVERLVKTSSQLVDHAKFDTMLRLKFDIRLAEAESLLKEAHKRMKGSEN